MILVMVNTIIIIIIFNNLIHTYAETPFRRMLICENSGLGGNKSYMMICEKS